MIAYDRRGAGEPLVLIHPLGADRHVWAPVIDRLAGQRHVIALDLPGFGESPALENGSPPDPAALATAVAAFLDGLGIERPHLAGNSLGGWVALELALAGRARSVTAIAPAGLWAQPLPPKPSPGRAIARAAAPVLPALLTTSGGRRAVLAATVAHPERVPAAEALRLVRTYAAAPGYGAVNSAMRAGRFLGLDRIDVPVTLAWPDRDRLVARPRRLPASVRSVVLQGCGHLPMWDDPEQVARLLLEGSGGSRPAAPPRARYLTRVRRRFQAMIVWPVASPSLRGWMWWPETTNFRFLPNSCFSDSFAGLM
jgi:pimeloyl-ACP methyl ester carboxylesterase